MPLRAPKIQIPVVPDIVKNIAKKKLNKKTIRSKVFYGKITNKKEK
jgi:hypothetical protein